MLEFSVLHQTLTRLDTTAVVSDSQNYLACGFQFSPDWEGVTPVAVFGHPDLEDPIAVPLTGGVCQVPHEVIRPYGFYLALYGSGTGADGEATHIPTDVAAVEVQAAGTDEGLEAAPPTADLYDSLMAQLRESAGTVTAAKTSALASAQAAQGAVGACEEAQESAQASAQSAQDQAQTATEAALSAQRSLSQADGIQAQAQEALAAAEAMEGRIGAVLVLQKSYALGTAEYAEVAALRSITWTDGQYVTGRLGLEEDRRYLVEVNGVRYDAVSELIPTPVTDPFQGVDDPEEEGGSGSSDSGEDEGIEEVPRPEDPGTDPGEQIDPDDPASTVLKKVKLVAGPVTLVDRWDVADDGLESQPGACTLTTTDASVTSVVLYTDGHDNGKYYMSEAKAAAALAKQYRDEARTARNQAQAIYAAIVNMT